MDLSRERIDLLDSIENSGPREPSVDSLRKYLKLVRDLRTRESEAVAKWGSLLLRKYSRSLPAEELWLVHEQVAIAALDCHAINLARSCVNAICQQFPDSIRAKRLKGMYYEAIEKFDAAEGIYDEVLASEPSNEMMLKRKAVLKKTKGDIVGATQALKTYLDTYMLDRDAWEELGELYLKQHLFKQAAFCFEELIMLSPNNLTYNLRYGDVLYTIGGNTSLKTALSYYSHSLELSAGTSRRALFGVCSCLSQLNQKGGVSDDEDGGQLGSLSVKALMQLYRHKCPEKLELVKTVLRGQGLLE